MTKAIGYVRVSSQDQVQGGVSLDNQKAKIKAYCELKNFKLTGIIEDAGISAKDLNRPGVQKVLDMARKKKIDHVVILKLDRLFRSTIDALETTKKFDKWGVSFHSIHETLDTQSAMGKFFFTLTAGLAEMERGIIGERTSAVLQHKKSKNEVYGEIPYGFRRKGKKLYYDKSEQRTLELARSLWEGGNNYSAISRQLNDRNIRTKKGGCWYPQTVKNIVQREVGKNG